MISEVLGSSRKIVIKVGSNTLAHPDGSMNRDFMKSFADQIHGLMENQKQIVIVSSGARIAGLSTIGKWQRKTDIHYKQALCAIGQVELMDSWRKAFATHGVHIAQLLLTREDFEDTTRSLNIRNTLFTLIDEGVIPIINENDTTCVDEIRIGDNDNLAALTTLLWSADLLILLSDIDGLYDKNPKEHADASLLERITDIESIKRGLGSGSANSFGVGGIRTKLEAAAKVTGAGIPMILANGSRSMVLQGLVSGTVKATLFSPEKWV